MDDSKLGHDKIVYTVAGNSEVPPDLVGAVSQYAQSAAGQGY